MKHLFVPYELALKLKDKGFDEPCMSYYFPDGGFMEAAEEDDTRFPGDLRFYEYSNSEGENIAAPLYQQVIDWFREKHSIRSYIDQRVLDIDSPNQWVYDFVVKTGDGVTKQPFFSGDFDSYQEAQIGCINYMLKLIL